MHATALLAPHTRFVKLVARAGNVTTSSTHASSMPSAQPNIKATAALLMQSNNNFAAHYFLLALLLAFVLCFLLAAPRLAEWLASGRSGLGWTIKAADRKSEEWGLHRQLMMSGVPLARKLEAVSAMKAHATTLYNKLLLPNAPFLHLTRGQVLVCLAYQALVLVFLFFRTPWSLDANFRRPGYIAVAQIPPVFLLATKNSLSVLLGKSYEKVNFLHRVAGRLLVGCSFLHAGLFLRNSTLNLSSPTVLSGAVACIGLLLICIPSISIIRNAFYRVFLVSHLVGWLTALVAINYHTPLARPYTVFSLSLYLLDLLLRLLKTRLTSATIVPLSRGMTMVQAHGLEEGWRVGQHVWVRVWVGKGKLGEAQPFTVANAPASCSPLSGQHKLTLLANSTGDWTKALNKEAAIHQGTSEKQAFGIGRAVRISVEGPYGGAGFLDFADSQSVLLVAGGSGITFAASILEEIVGRASSSGVGTRNVTLVWTMRDLACVEWYEKFLNELVRIARSQTTLALQLKLFVTRPSKATTSPLVNSTLSTFRPNLDAILSTLIEDTLDLSAAKSLARGGGIAVGTCGPAGLVKQMRSTIAAVGRERAVAVGGIVSHEETFGW